MRILGHREVKKHSQGHTARKWQSWDSKPSFERATVLCSEAGIIIQHSHPRPMLSFPGAHDPPPPVIFLSGQCHLQLVFPPRDLVRGLREEREPPCGESGNLRTWAQFSMCVLHLTSPAFWHFVSWKYQHTSHLFYSIYLKFKKFKLFIAV